MLKKNSSFLNLGENYLLPSLLPLGPTQTRVNPLYHRKMAKFQGKSEGGPSRWVSLGRRRSSVKERERDREIDRDRDRDREAPREDKAFAIPFPLSRRSTIPYKAY